MDRIADGIFCETAWEGANLGAIATGEGIVLVDSPMLPRDARTWTEELENASDESVVLLINTDYHFDHMMTDCLLSERVIAHALAEAGFLAQDGEVFEQMVNVFFPDVDKDSRREIRKLEAVAPVLTFSENLVLNLGSRRIEVTHMGGHTPATSVVHAPDDGILFTGDVHVHNRHPFPGDGNLLQWITALERISKMDATKIVPGHGDICDKKSVRRLKQYFEEMKGQVETLMDKGYDREKIEEEVDILSFFPIEDGKESRTESFVRLGIGRMYSQLAESANDKNKR